MSHQKPAERRGLVCHFVRWDKEGRIIEARYRRPERSSQDQDSLL